LKRAETAIDRSARQHYREMAATTVLYPSNIAKMERYCKGPVWQSFHFPQLDISSIGCSFSCIRLGNRPQTPLLAPPRGRR
jgi:hypothetical protein